MTKQHNKKRNAKKSVKKVATKSSKKSSKSSTVKKDKKDKKDKKTMPKTQDEILNIQMPTRRIKRNSDGLYEVDGKFYKELVGNRDDVWKGIAYKTNHNVDALTREDLIFDDKTKKVLSKSKHELMSGSDNPLRKLGLLKKSSKKMKRKNKKKSK
jgi:hypothetical protein